MHTTAAHATPALAEADRLMVICNSCRYCEGLCAVFPAMEKRRIFEDADLNYLANLCHACGACYSDCQFSPPHEFAVNVPQALARVRAESYQAYAWPHFLSNLFTYNGLAVTLSASLGVAAFLSAFLIFGEGSIVFGREQGPGAFYRLMPHTLMVGVFGSAFLYSVAAIIISSRRFWRDISKHFPLRIRSIWRAATDAANLRYLDGGKGGCVNEDDRPNDRRNYFHHLTFYGFLLCFLSTSVATLYHYLLGREAPYSLYDLPVVLGGAGGLGLIFGPLGLLVAKLRRDPALGDDKSKAMDFAFILMLLLTSTTGLLLLLFRATAGMELLLAIHLGVVVALFLMLPYSKFVHGVYRLIALMQYANEKRS